MKKVQGAISESNIYVMYYDQTFYLGQVQKLFHKDYDMKNLLEVEMKFSN